MKFIDIYFNVADPLKHIPIHGGKLSSYMVPIRFLYFPIANLDSYTLPIRKKTIFDEFLYGRCNKYMYDRSFL